MSHNSSPQDDPGKLLGFLGRELRPLDELSRALRELKGLASDERQHGSALVDRAVRAAEELERVGRPLVELAELVEGSRSPEGAETVCGDGPQDVALAPLLDKLAGRTQAPLTIRGELGCVTSAPEEALRRTFDCLLDTWSRLSPANLSVIARREVHIPVDRVLVELYVSLPADSPEAGFGRTISQHLAHRIGAEMTLANLGSHSVLTFELPTSALDGLGSARRDSVHPVLAFSRGGVPAAHHLENEVHKPLILVGDREPSVVKYMKDTLELEGFEVTIASSFDELCERAKSLRPDVVTIGGIERELDDADNIERLQKDPILSTTPLLLISESDDAERLREAIGAAALVPKPIETGVLIDALRRETGERRSPVLLLCAEPVPEWVDGLETEGIRFVHAVDVPRARAYLERMTPAAILIEAQGDEDVVSFARSLPRDDEERRFPVVVVQGSLPKAQRREWESLAQVVLRRRDALQGDVPRTLIRLADSGAPMMDAGAG